MSRKILLICIVILLSVITLVGAFYLFVLSGAIFIFSTNPSAPEITYGEFPISIIYEINGERKMIDDTIICEFDGIENLGSAGKCRRWRSYLKSGNTSLTLVCIEEENLKIEIGVSRGFPEYYMGDFQQRSKEEYEQIMADNSYFGCVKWENGVRTGYSMPRQEAWDKYKLKVLDIQYSQPIENSFK